MPKCISFGSWNQNYKYIFISIIFIALFNIIDGIGYDLNPEYFIIFFNNGIFSNNYLIHQIFLYLGSILVSCVFILIEKIIDYKEKKEKRKIKEVTYDKNSYKNYLNLIYKEIKGKKISKLFIILIVFIIVLNEQFSIIFFKFFRHMYFWMTELYFLAFLYLKIFKIEIYKHQYLAFAINFISIILTFVKIFLTIAEGNEKIALYVKYWWLIFIGLLLFIFHAFLVSFSLVQLKSVFYLKFIPISHIVLIYGIIGLLFCVILSTIFSFNSCGNKIENIFEIKDYICKIIDNNNQTFIENFNIYFSEYWKNSEIFEKRNEIITLIFKSIFFALHKYFEMKIIESLTPFHRIFSSAVYNCTEIIFFLFYHIARIVNDDNKYFKSKLLIDFFSYLLCIITFLIYLEIIEINFCFLNYNLRKNIILRGIIDDDSDKLDLNKNPIIDDEENNSDSDDNISN